MVYGSAHVMATVDPSNDFSTRGPVVMGVSAATLALCSLFVGLRLVSRFLVVRKPGWDDYTMILAWILAFGASFSICYGTTKGLGRRKQDIPADWLRPMKQTSYAFSVLYVSCCDSFCWDLSLFITEPCPDGD
jgi:hypothetical protein